MNGSIRTLLLTIVLALMTTASAAQDLRGVEIGLGGAGVDMKVKK